MYEANQRPETERKGTLKGGHDPHEMARRSAEVRRQRKAEREARLQALGEGPRETIALALIEEREALAELVKTLVRLGAKGDLKAAQTLVRFLDQGLGRVEEHKATQPQGDDLASIPREERAQMIAELRRQLAERDEEVDRPAE